MKKILNIFYKAYSYPFLACRVIYWNLRSLKYQHYIDSGKGRIIMRDSSIKLKIKKGKNAKFNLYGNLIIESFKNDGPVTISIGENATIDIFGDFNLGDGIKISLMKNSYLSFGGKKDETASGITGNTLIMVEKKIEIGVDFICAWDVFITDSDWHSIIGYPHQKDVKIGNHVWIANNNNILKGTVLGNNCIVSSCSKVSNKVFLNNQLIGGVPAKVLKENISWKRDVS